MSFISKIVGTFALTWSVALLTACGPSGETSSSSNASSDGVSRLATAQRQASAAVLDANVAPAAPNIDNDCLLKIQGSVDPSKATATFAALQAQITAIIEDIQKQDQTALDADVKTAYDIFLGNLGGLLDDVEACIPPPSSTPVNPPVLSAGGGVPGLQGVDISQFLGQMGGAR